MNNETGTDKERENFMKKVDQNGPIPQPWTFANGLGPCWTWLLYIDGLGYGHASYRGTSLLAHRVSYMLFKGPIPPKHQIDHLCRNRECENPDHLEAVTQAENIRRGDAMWCNGARQKARTHCVHGHEFTSENTFINSRGRRTCVACRKLRDKEQCRKARELSRLAGKIANGDKTHCPRGHAFDEANTGYHTQSNGRTLGRHCRACARLKEGAKRRGISVEEYADLIGEVIPCPKG